MERLVAQPLNKLDVNIATAVEVFGVVAADVSRDQLRAAKVINFGLIHGLNTARATYDKQ